MVGVLPEALVSAKITGLRVSVKKLAPIARSLCGKDVTALLGQLRHSEKRIAANEVRKLLQSVAANAENNHGLDTGLLYVVEAFVGKGLCMKRLDLRARGRTGRIRKPFSTLFVTVAERRSNGAEN